MKTLNDDRADPTGYEAAIDPAAEGGDRTVKAAFIPGSDCEDVDPAAYEKIREWGRTLGIPARVFVGEPVEGLASTEYERWLAGRDRLWREVFDGWLRSALEPAVSPLPPEDPAADEPVMVEVL